LLSRAIYPVDPVDPVRKINRPFDTEAHDRQNTLLRHSTFDTCPPEEDPLFDIRFFRVSFSNRLPAFQVSGDAHMKLHESRCHFQE
jgi:hypothetical protein